MHKILLAIFVLAMAGMLPIGAEAKIPQALAAHLAEPENFRMQFSPKDLPPALLKLCADTRGTIAAPGEAWEATDDSGGDTLPRARLLWAATDGAIYIVHYERGGFGHGWLVLIAEIAPDGGIKPVWKALAPAALPDFSAFASALNAGTLNDRPEIIRAF